MKNRSSFSWIGIVVVIAVCAALLKLLGSISIGSTLLLIGRIALIAIAALVILVLVFAFRGSSKEAKARKAEEVPIDDENAAILKHGREKLMALRHQMIGVKNNEIRNSGNEICGVVDKILTTLREKPEKIPSVRQFFNYYLPTLSEITAKFIRIEKSGVPNEDMTEKVKKYFGDIKGAMDKQYANLFEDDKLDMSVDMEAMTIACKRDGLITGDGVQAQEGGGKIELTL